MANVHRTHNAQKIDKNDNIGFLQFGPLKGPSFLTLDVSSFGFVGFIISLIRLDCLRPEFSRLIILGASILLLLEVALSPFVNWKYRLTTNELQ